MEFRVPALRPVVREGCLGPPAAPRGPGPGPGTPHPGLHRGAGPPLRSRSPNKKGGQAQQALGRSRGGFSTKIHLSAEALGQPQHFALTPGQAHDLTKAYDLLYAAPLDQVEKVLADRNYDANDFRQAIQDGGAEAVIPPRGRRTHPLPYDTHVYRERHLVECLVNKLKHYRRLFSRFDKLADHYLGFLHFVGALLWLR